MRKLVCCLAGLDPSGGAGLQADIEAVAAMGAHACVCATALTVQTVNAVQSYQVVDAQLLTAQLHTLTAAMPFRVIKSGMLGNAANAAVLQAYLAAQPQPLTYVCDPVMAANSGGNLGDGNELRAAYAQLMPYVTLLTPNTLELAALTNCHDELAAVKRLSDMGAKAILLKGGHADSASSHISNRLYVLGDLQLELVLPRQPGQYHGTGCSLAAAISALLAQGHSLNNAVSHGHVWLQSAVRRAELMQPSDQQHLLNRWG